MRRLALFAVAAIAAALVSTPALAQPVGFPRDGVINRAVVNTICADFKAKNRTTHCSDAEFTATMNQVQAAINAAAIAGKPLTGNTGSGSTAPSWHEVLTALGLPWPFKLGDDYSPNHFYGGGSFGGGGAGGSWTDAGGETSCGVIDYSLDVQGNLVIPSYWLATGKAIKVATGTGTGTGGSPYWYMGQGDQPANMAMLGNGYVQADSYEATLRRYFHLYNIRGPQAEWYGILGPARETNWAGYGPNCYEFATVAYRRPDNTIVPRKSDVSCATGPLVHNQVVASNENPATPNNAPHKDCPPDGAGGSDFHFYGDSDNGHWHTCIMYFPSLQAGWKGYALNKKTSLRAMDKWKWLTILPAWIKKCGVDRDLIRKLAQEVLQEVEPGATIDPTSSRPGDATVNDLNDDPTQGTTNPPADPDAPAPPTPTPQPPGGTGGQDECDFGPTGCDNPNTPTPGLEATPTGIMDPIFNWLPDLPSITIPDLSSECPVWTINLSASMGPDWVFLLDSHCDLAESIRGALGALMIAVWGIGAALIVLRA